MGYSPLLSTTPKMKFIVTAACNQLGYSSSTAYKIYVVLLEGHGPYAAIDYPSIVSFSRILTSGRETPILHGCPRQKVTEVPQLLFTEDMGNSSSK